MDFSGEGDVTAAVTPVDVNLAGDRATTSGCETADFAGFPAGNIALIQRGTCNFSVKADNAAAAGAAGVIVFNQGNVVPGDDRLGLFGGTLDPPVRPIPVVSAPFALGAEWATTAGLTMRLNLEAEIVSVTTENLLADTPTGRTDRTVVVGGHLDSVAEGPGINDNGSGTAAILETALQMAALGIEPENRVRFAFWSGEEDGLIGSSYYVSQLTKKEIQDTALNLNFDMVGSTNAVNFVYDGDGDALGVSGPNGSGVIEDVFTDFFSDQGESSEPTDFDGRSDYFGFIEAGIPAGGLFTGAEGIKSAAQAAMFGGTAGEPYDACYHAACDDITNIDEDTLDLMADAIAHSTLTFAETESAVNGTGKGKATGQTDLAFKGDRGSSDRMPTDGGPGATGRPGDLGHDHPSDRCHDRTLTAASVSIALGPGFTSPRRPPRSPCDGRGSGVVLGPTAPATPPAGGPTATAGARPAGRLVSRSWRHSLRSPQRRRRPPPPRAS